MSFRMPGYRLSEQEFQDLGLLLLECTVGCVPGISSCLVRHRTCSVILAVLLHDGR